MLNYTNYIRISTYVNVCEFTIIPVLKMLSV